MKLRIDDDLDLEKIAQSGQCFRAVRRPDGAYRFITGENVLYLKPEGKGAFTASCNEDEWDGIWRPYFDLGRNYRSIYNGELNKHPFIREAMEYGQGLRILRQDPWETLITFIISQRKNIPAISKAVETLSRKFGHKLKTLYEELYTFPSPSEMSGIALDDLSDCSLGYRAKYVLDAIERAANGSLDLEALNGLDDESLLKSLQDIYGVGKKVANCVALFAYGRMGCVPIDVWISRAIAEDFGGQSPFGLFGENAGIIQQYVFFYERSRERLT